MAFACKLAWRSTDFFFFFFLTSDVALLHCHIFFRRKKLQCISCEQTRKDAIVLTRACWPKGIMVWVGISLLKKKIYFLEWKTKNKGDYVVWNRFLNVWSKRLKICFLMLMLPFFQDLYLHVPLNPLSNGFTHRTLKFLHTIMITEMSRLVSVCAYFLSVHLKQIL